MGDPAAQGRLRLAAASSAGGKSLSRVAAFSVAIPIVTC